MKRRQSKIRMGLLRGRAGFLTYTLFGMVAVVAIYYVWNSFYRPPAKISMFSVQGPKLGQQPGYWDKQKFAVDAPIGLNKEIEIQKSEQWKKAHVLQDLIDEENIMEEKAAQQKVKIEKGASLERPAVNRDMVAGKATKKQSPLFRPADPVLDGAYFTKLERIVHLDLKGAPPLVSYLERLFPFLKKMGATGLLMEYEDMFPYSGNITLLAAQNAYSNSDLQRIQKAAEANNLEIIPLVQTFGHMEFVLKHEAHRHLREHDYTPQVITPSKEESYALIFNILEQVQKAHPNSRRIHLGCDEVYGLGKGQSSDLITSQRIDPGRLFLRHVERVSRYIKKNFPKIQPLIWDDWLRSIPFDQLADSGLSSLVEPMVWYYQHNILDRMPNDRWEIYGKLFPNVWVASAFKGATGSAQILTNASVHLDNNLQWVEIIRTYGLQEKSVTFRGLVLTGWQRYDHFATLCELLPVGMPSLALSLQAVQSGGFGLQEWVHASSSLNCSNKLALEFPTLKKQGAVVTQDCNFPGRAVYYAMEQLWGILEVFKRDRGLQERIAGWMTDLHLRQGFSNPGQMQILVEKLSKVIDKLKMMVKPMQDSLLEVYDNSTVDEWITANLADRINKLKELLKKATTLKEFKVWPARPFAKPSPKEDYGDVPDRQDNDVANKVIPYSEQRQLIGSVKKTGLNMAPKDLYQPGNNPQNIVKQGEKGAVPEIGSQRNAGNYSNLGQVGGRPLMQALMSGSNNGVPSGPVKQEYIPQSASKNVANHIPENVLSQLKFHPGMPKQIPQMLDGKIALGPPQKLSQYSQRELGQHPQELRHNPIRPQYNLQGLKLPQNPQGLSQNSQWQPQNPQGVLQNVHKQHPQGLPRIISGQSHQSMSHNLQGQRSEGVLLKHGLQNVENSQKVDEYRQNVQRLRFGFEKKKDLKTASGTSDLGKVPQSLDELHPRFLKENMPERANGQLPDTDEKKDGGKIVHLPEHNKASNLPAQNNMKKVPGLGSDTREESKYLNSFLGRRIPENEKTENKHQDTDYDADDDV